MTIFVTMSNIKISHLTESILELTDFDDVNKILSVILHKVQEHVIGYRKDYSGEWTCVVENGEYYVKTYEVLKSFGLSIDQLSKGNVFDEVVLFPDGKKLSDMIKEPIEFYEWTNKNLK